VTLDRLRDDESFRSDILDAIEGILNDDPKMSVWLDKDFCVYLVKPLKTWVLQGVCIFMLPGATELSHCSARIRRTTKGWVAWQFADDEE
jgi:hypothetical protein